MDKQTIENYFQQKYIAFYSKYLPDIKRVGKTQMAICPFHDDHHPSLSIDDQKGLFKCFGCGASGDIYEFYAKKNNLNTRSDFQKILNKIAEAFGITNGERPEKSTIIASYDYLDESANLQYQIVRLEPKQFRIRRPDGNDGWIYDKKGITIVPYHLPLIINDLEVIIVEGEKDADNLIALGITATTNPFGAGNWPEHFGPYFAGKNVVLIPDNDDTGRQHMDKVAANLKGHAASIKYLKLPDLPEKGDISDFIAKSGSKEEATEQLAIMLGGAALYEPPAINNNTDNCYSADDKITRAESYGEATTNYIGEKINRPSLAWPDPLDEAAYHGVIGDWVKQVEPHTEADSAALLFQGLVIFGNILGPNPHFMVEATEHRCNENLLLVGDTSKGRKGTSWDHARRIGKAIDLSWESECIKSGLTSG